MRRYKIRELCEIVGVKDDVVHGFVTHEWIVPAADDEFDEEDLARVRLILELMKTFEINQESVPLILHLVDQIHRLHFEIERHTAS